MTIAKDKNIIIQTYVYNPYRFGGKELLDVGGLDLYDFGTRHYTPALPRWLTMDPLAEKYYGVSPYLYCANNPVSLFDSDGREPIKNLAGTVDGLVRFMNGINAEGLGLSKGAEAHIRMLELGKVNGITPVNTRPFFLTLSLFRPLPENRPLA